MTNNSTSQFLAQLDRLLGISPRLPPRAGKMTPPCKPPPCLKAWISLMSLPHKLNCAPVGLLKSIA